MAVLSTGSTNSLWLRRKTTPGELVRRCGTGLRCRRKGGTVLPALVTDPTMRDRPVLEEEKRRCPAHRCESGPAMRDYPAVQVKKAVLCGWSLWRCLTGPAMRDRSALQLKRRRCAARHGRFAAGSTYSLLATHQGDPRYHHLVTNYPASCKALLHYP
jgi:hypothetical protein